MEKDRNIMVGKFEDKYTTSKTDAKGKRFERY
jgi:hypothetical protein